MDNYKILFKLLGILCVTGFSKETTTPSQQDCYTQPPGRGKNNHVMTCVDKYAIIPGQLYCQLNIQRHPLSEDEQNEIQAKHNEIRSRVNPKAANMLALKYNSGLARTAQIWGEMCQLKPSNPLQRFRPGSYIVGENVYVSAKNLSWSDVIDIWAHENSSFSYGIKGNNKSLVSNYTQLVWANTSVVGCSKTVCGGTYFYVCNYAPAMDYGILDKPYESSNQSCSQCPNNCTNNLCDCSGIICLNGAELDYKTCLCDCIPEVRTYNAPTCKLVCEQNGDDPGCGTTYGKSTCQTSFVTLFHCPWMCNICPYAGENYTERSEPLPWERNRTECPTGTSTSMPLTSAAASNGLRTTKITTQQQTKTRTKSPRQGTFPATRSKLTQTSIQGSAYAKQTTKTVNQTSESAQMNNKPCGNSASYPKLPRWVIVFVFILVM